MTLLNNLLQNWSRYEIYTELSLLLSIFVIILLTIYLVTKNRKMLLLSTVAYVVASLLNIIGIFLVHILLKIEITEVFRIIPIITYILLASNIGILVGFYISRKDAKGFKIKSIRKEYLSDSIKQTVFLVLLGASIMLFTSVQTKLVISISILSTLLSIWFTYWLSKYILK